MSKETAVILLGFWIVIVPQLGVPTPGRTVILTLSGLALIVIGFYLRAAWAARRTHDYVESAPTHGASPSAPQPSSSHESDGKSGINSLN